MCLPPRGAGSRHRGDQLAGRQRGFHVRRGAGQLVEIGDRDGAARAVGAHGLDRGVERAHGHGHVARMRGDAGLARAYHRMLARVAADGRAAAARLALVAGLVGVVEVRAARALQQVARGGRLVAQLARGTGQQRARQQAVVAPHAGVGGQVGVAHQRTDAQAAVGGAFDLVEAEAVDVDQVRGRLDLQLHQVEQVGAAGNEARAGQCGCRVRQPASGRRDAFVGEGPHDVHSPPLR
jgi:hypothetical protein